jgi:hypothetical protein
MTNLRLHKGVIATRERNVHEWVEASEFDTRWGGVPVVRSHGVAGPRGGSEWPLTHQTPKASGSFCSLNRSNPDA